MIKINKYLLLIIFTFFGIISISKAETLEDIGKELGEIRQEIADLKISNVEEAIKIDSALIELEQVMDFVEKNVQKGDLETAISTINIAETTLKDISKSIPSELKTIKIETGKEFNDQEMQEISKITDGLNKNTKIQKEKISKDISLVQEKGLDVNTISKNISASGIKTSLISNKVNKNLVANTSLQKELSDQEKYGAIIGNSPEKVSVAMRQVNVIQSGNPKDHRALEIEKYGIEAGLSKAQIQKGIDAVYSGNIKAETEVTKEIYSKLSQDQNWEVQTADIDGMIQQNIAVEKAASAILNSGIDFAKGTNNKAIDILSNQVAKILANTTDQATIDKITYKIGRTKYEIWEDPNAVAANMIAEIAGPDQVTALVNIKNDQKFGITESLVEQAARTEAFMNNDIDSFVAASKGSLENVKLSQTDKAQLGEVYKEAISSKSLSASVNSIDGEFKSAASIAAISDVEDMKKAKEIINQNDVTSKAFEKFINTKYEGDGSEWKAARKEYLEAFSLSEELNVKNNMNLDSASKLLEAAGDISSSLSSTTKSAATDVSASVSEAAKDVATSVSTSVAENTNEIAQDIAKEVAQEVAEEVAQEVSKDLAKEVAEEVGKTLADLKAEERAAWEEYSKDGWNMEKKQKHLDASEAVRKKERETSQ
jgi:hypothetical protein